VRQPASVNYVSPNPPSPGIYFLSLGGDSRAAVAAARRSYRLPCFHSRISAGSAGDGFHFDSTRTSSDGSAAYFVARSGPRGQPIPIRDGSLERWLMERNLSAELGDASKCSLGSGGDAMTAQG
jgi:uncharacterized protein YqjF (DUF2071 family)